MLGNVRRLGLVLFVCSFLIFPSHSALAAASKQPAETAKKAKTATKKATTNKEAAAEATTPQDDAKAEESFTTFTQEWLQKVNSHGNYGPGSTTVEEDSGQSGSYVASYVQIGNIEETKVKKTETKGTPYVGTVTYLKITYASKGKTPEEARAGSFTPASREKVTEVFRYAKGKWVY